MTIHPEMKGERILRSLARGFAALILLLPVNSYALGLGEIELHSALNQPLEAEISLLSADSVNPEELKVELASSNAFAQAEVDRPVFLTKIKFEIDHKSDGSLFIRVTSEDSIKEPFIDFLVEVNWPNGRLLREYTVLLDPPVLLDDKPAPIEPASTSVTPQTGQSVSSAGKTADSAPQQSRSQHTVTQIQSSAGGLQYGPVTRTDTLWSIASQLRPNKSVTVQQVMMALLKSNPEAFYNNNINELKAGYVLRIHDPDLITAMSAEEALRESRQQYRQWLDAKQNAGQSPSQRAIGSEAASSAGQGVSTGEAGGAKLKLVAPGAAEGSSTTSGLQSRSKELESLREELAVALETSDVTRQENDELRSRITALEDELASIKRLMTLHDDTAAAIQASETPSDSGVQTTDIAEPAPEVEVNVPKTAQPPAPPPAPATAPSPPPAPAAPIEEGAFDMLLKDPVTLVVGLLIILILVVLVWMKIRQRQLAADGFDEGILAAAEEVADESDTAIASAVGGYAAESALDAIETDSDEMDVLAEADVYLAYRRFDKAIELLNEALQNEPDRSDYKLKLMEVYAESENIDAFVAQAEQLYAAIGPQGGPVWDRVVQLGKKLTPDHPLFSSAETSSAGDTAETTDSADDGSLAVDFMESGESTGIEDNTDLDIPATDMEEDLSFQDTAAQDSGDASENIFADNFEDSETITEESESPASVEDEDLASSFTMTEDELASGDAESGIADITSDESSDSITDDGALSFDVSDETGPGDVPAAESEIEDLSFEPSDSQSEETVEDDNRNVIDFESGLSPSSEETLSEEVMEPQDSTIEDVSATEDMGNALEFESGLSPEQTSDEDQKKNITEDVTPEDVDSAEDILEYDLDTLSEEGTTDEAGDVASNKEDDLSGLSGSAQEQPEDSQENQGTDDDDLGLDDDLDWLSNIDDDISLDDSSADEPEGNDSAQIASGDEVDTKLDLAKAYIDMDDKESARGILDEIAQEGNEEQKREAEELMQQIA